MLVSGGKSKKEGVRGFGAYTWSNVGACKSYCMNFDSFKIVDSGLP